MSSLPSESEIFEACRILFGQQVLLSREFLFYLQPGGAKTAFRQKAKETHPDLYQGDDPEILQRHTETFREVTQAYKLVSTFLKEREEHSGHAFRFAPHPHRREESSSRAEAGPFSNGAPRPSALPFRVLEIGLFLYYRQIVSFRTLAEALVWQRRQRPALGEIAKRWGWLKDADLARIRAARIPFARFGEKAVHLGLLTPAQVRTLLFFQRSQQKRLGQFFVERGLISAQQMECYVEELRLHNACVRSGNRS